MKFTKYSGKERILAILLAFVILFGSITTTALTYGVPQQSNDSISSYYNSGIQSRDGNGSNNYKNVGASGLHPSVEARQAENTIIDNNTTSINNSNSNNNSNSKEITLVAEDAEIEIAPGKRVKTWTFNGTVPAPILRFTEGDNVTIHFTNKSPIPHTIHFHGNHDDKNDGVVPQVLPNQTYTYHITAQPAGAINGSLSCSSYIASHKNGNVWCINSRSEGQNVTGTSQGVCHGDGRI